MTLLILGGTADGRKLADSLHRKAVPVIYSVAGLVRMPDVNCQVVSGGFKQFGGLVEYIRRYNITAILDVTHPYAHIMTTTAMAAAKQCDISYWRFHRPAWQQQERDYWQLFQHWDDLQVALNNFNSVFLTCGQLTQQQLDGLSGDVNQQFLLRTAVKPKQQLPPNTQWLKAIGPFALDDELALMAKHAIDVLVSKNSGGEATEAKLHAARALNIPVLMLDRPTLPAVEQQFTTRANCETYVLTQFNGSNKPHAF